MTPSAYLAALVRPMSIRRKLHVVIIATTMLALLFAGCGIIIADIALFYESLQRDLTTFVQIIGDDSTGALAFNDQQAGQETLAPLRARTHVSTACLYRNDGSLLAMYVRPGYTGACPRPQPEHIERHGGTLRVFHTILRAGAPVGNLVLEYDLGELMERVQLYGGLVVLTLLGASVIAFVLSGKLRGFIAAPILELANAAQTIADTKNYTIRTKERGSDEIGVLARALNQMLDTIESRDQDLRNALTAELETGKRLAQLNTDLTRSNQDLERVAFVASHDLQEPLRMINSYAQLLVASQPDTNPTYVRYITNGTNRMRELLADLLTYAEVSGAMEQPLQNVDLNVVVQQALGTLRDRITESHSEITVDALPTIRAHEGRMASIFLNLLSNAIKYHGEQPPRIHVTAAVTPEHVKVAVTDNGVGIAPEYHEKVFVAFKRLHGRDIPGTGIGLAICQRIVERYGGRIWVESTVGQGATFRFTLPKVAPEVEKNEGKPGL